MKFINTHDSDIVKSYFTNTVLTPTEAAQIVAKVSASDKASSSNTQIAKSSSSTNVKRSNTSVSPLRKTTPTRGNQKPVRGMLLSSSNTPSKNSVFESNFNATGETQGLQNLANNTD